MLVQSAKYAMLSAPARGLGGQTQMATCPAHTAGPIIVLQPGSTLQLLATCCSTRLRSCSGFCWRSQTISTPWRAACPPPPPTATPSASSPAPGYTWAIICVGSQVSCALMPHCMSRHLIKAMKLLIFINVTACPHMQLMALPKKLLVCIGLVTHCHPGTFCSKLGSGLVN